MRLGEVIADAQTGFACGERDQSGVIQLRMNNVDTRGNCVWNDYIRVPADDKTIRKYQLKPGDILFNNTNSVELVGKTAMFTGYQEPVVYSNHFTRLRTKTDLLDAGYLANWLLSQWQDRVFEAAIRLEIELFDDEFVVMPNHIHGIVWIVGATGRSPLQLPRRGPAKRSLSSFVAGFKSAVTKRINEHRGMPGTPVWQRNYYEHIIRNDESLNRIREYITTNPIRWDEDEKNPYGKRQETK